MTTLPSWNGSALASTYSMGLDAALRVVVLAGHLRSGLRTRSQPTGPSEPQDVGIGLRRQLLGLGIIGDAQGTLRSVLDSDDQSVMDQLVEDGGERGGRNARCNCKRRTPIVRRPTAEVRVAGGKRRCSRRPCRTSRAATLRMASRNRLPRGRRPRQRQGAQPEGDVGRQRAGLPVQPVAEERLHRRVDHPEVILQRPDGVLAGMPPRSRRCASTAAALILSGPTSVMMSCSRQCSESSMANWSPAALG